MTQVVLPTLAVAGIWALLAVVFGGCGAFVRRALIAALGLRPAGRLAIRDVWIGLAALTGYLLIWNMFAAITWWTWVAPLVVGAAGAVLSLPEIRRPALGSVRSGARGAAILGAVGLGWLVLANEALGPTDDYDFGLYHLDLITYAEHYAALPGLANLHSRLGAGDAHLLLAAFVDQRPLRGAGPHLVGGLLVALLLLDVGARWLRAPEAKVPSFCRRLALLLVPAAAIVVARNPQSTMTSPNLDLAAFVLVSVGLLYLADSLEHDLDPVAAVTATAVLATASATRPLYWPVTLFAAVVLVAGTARRSEPRSAASTLRTAALVCIVPAVVAGGWLARQAVLSGYPLYPLTVGGLSVDWRVPVHIVASANRGDDAWARWPGTDPNVVLASWHWLRASWLQTRNHDVDVWAPLLLLACLVPSFIAWREPDRSRRRRTRPMLAVVIPCCGALVAWFLTAPDPRFVLAPLWLVPAALTAWALPPLGRASKRAVATVAVVAIGAGVALDALVTHDAASLLPLAVGLWAVVGAFVWLERRRRAAPLVAYAAAGSAVVAALLIVIGGVSAHPERATGSGPLGIRLPGPVALTTVVTSSGLRLSEPADNGDQCWQEMLCVPLLVDPALHLRGTRISAGFAIGG
jgi:hypothetical protein